jgi:FlaA1/EpsC-like NDP-sugar epimerase
MFLELKVNIYCLDLAYKVDNHNKINSTHPASFSTSQIPHSSLLDIDSLPYFSNSANMSIVDILNDIRKTNVTKTIHQKPYDAILPTRPELSQVGRTVLITGGGTGAGLAMAHAFIRASAETIVIIGRRAEVLEAARLKLEDEVKSIGTNTRIVIRACDGTKVSDIDALWQYLGDQNILVDVYIANAAKFTEPKPMMELGTDEVWSQMETNVWSPLYFTEKFCKQPGDKQKVGY